ncbi:DUF3592 domain-containing protein [Streptomyces sp. HNM0574]|uniref:DUF3592 domain-containing protein n=1 Tax=Streptomyces sp. HNM0574 TaxID=2714954 RepID=UPI00146D9938|nr:DUF3592 domain-containing protein [Streptomyces sp. HNM0574]
MTVWGALSLLAGLAVLGFGIREVLTQLRLQREGIRAVGTVVRHHESHSGNSGPSYFAVVEFLDARGGRHTFQAASSGVKGLPVGGPAPVLYRPDDPETARIALTGRRIGDVVLLLTFGTVFTATGIWLLATGR